MPNIKEKIEVGKMADGPPENRTPAEDPLRDYPALAFLKSIFKTWLLSGFLFVVFVSIVGFSATFCLVNYKSNQALKIAEDNRDEIDEISKDLEYLKGGFDQVLGNIGVSGAYRDPQDEDDDMTITAAHRQHTVGPRGILALEYSTGPNKPVFDSFWLECYSKLRYIIWFFLYSHPSTSEESYDTEALIH